MMQKTRTQKISLLREIKETDDEVANLFDLVCLICPYILDDPEGAPDISIDETRKSLLI